MDLVSFVLSFTFYKRIDEDKRFLDNLGLIIIILSDTLYQYTQYEDDRAGLVRVAKVVYNLQYIKCNIWLGLHDIESKREGEKNE